MKKSKKNENLFPVSLQPNDILTKEGENWRKRPEKVAQGGLLVAEVHLEAAVNVMK